MKLDPSISLGTIIQIAIFVITFVVAYTKFVQRLARLETKINILWAAFTRQRGWTGDPAHDEDFFPGHDDG